MPQHLEKAVYKNQRPWFEIWFAVVVDRDRRRALWIRETLFVPREGDGRSVIWGAWFDADAGSPVAAKRIHPLAAAELERDDVLIAIADSSLARTFARGSVDGLAWDVTWGGGAEIRAELPAWVPAPTHAQPIAHDAEATGRITIGSTEIEISGRAKAMHLWGKKRVPTLQWIWAPWLGDASLEIQAASIFGRESMSIGLSTLRMTGGETVLAGRPITAAHASGLVTAIAAGPRTLVHARAWAEPSQMVGYAYRNTDGRDLKVAQSDIGAAHLEMFSRPAPGVPWKLVEERRVAGGVAVEIHQRAALPDVDYIGWDDTARPAFDAPASAATSPGEDVAWPDVTAIVALGLTYGDHVRETGQKLDSSAPPTSFTKDVRAWRPGDGSVAIPAARELLAALETLEPGLETTLHERFPALPAVMDYEGELALVALGPIDDEGLAAGEPQPFGVAAANDLTARLCQVLGETMDRSLDYWACAKSFPDFLPVSPQVWAPANGLVRMPELTLETRVNGTVRQRASTKLLIYDLPAIVRAARAHLGRPLARGDLILTGTPAGVGLRMSPLKRRVAALVKSRFRKVELLISMYATSDRLLRPGDVVEVDAGPAGRVRTRLGVG